MSIKNFSKTYFVEVATDIIKTDDFIVARNVDKLKENTSFREVLDITSLDIAELIVATEEKFNVNMELTLTEKVDSIDDLYVEFLKAVNQKRKSFAQKQMVKNKALTK